MIAWPTTDAGMCGLAGSLFLLVPVARDQLARRKIGLHRKRGEQPAGTLDKDVADGLQDRASSWHPIDSGSLFAGGVLLALSYTLTS